MQPFMIACSLVHIEYGRSYEIDPSAAGALPGNFDLPGAGTGPREYRGRLLAHGKACPNNRNGQPFGCVGHNVDNHTVCCTECAKASYGSLGQYKCGMRASQSSYHGTAGTAWNQEQCGCSIITAADSAYAFADTASLQTAVVAYNADADSATATYRIYTVHTHT